MFGVLATVGFGVWNTGRQLKNASVEAERNRKHESDEAQVDRLRNARREVYSDLVEAFIAVQGAFGRMQDADPADPAFGAELRAMGTPVNKTWLVSQEETAHKARELYTVMNEHWLALIPKLGQIIRHKDLLQYYKDRREEIAEHVVHIKSTTGITSLAQSTHWEEDQNLKSKQMEQSEILNKARLGLASEVLENQTVIMLHINGLMLSARKELGITDESGVALGTDTLAKQSGEMTDRMRAAIDKLQQAMGPFVFK